MKIKMVDTSKQIRVSTHKGNTTIIETPDRGPAIMILDNISDRLELSIMYDLETGLNRYGGESEY